MEIVAGKEVLTTLDEIVDPAHSALVIVDLQNDFIGKGGLWDKLGLDLSMAPEVVTRVKRPLEAARASGVKIVYIKMSNLSDPASMSGPRLKQLVVKGGQPPEQVICTLGSWGAEIVPELAPHDGDIIVPKWRYSAFLGTPLDQILRSYGIQSVVLCGATTSVCVESTARDAFQHDYYVVLATDCVADVRRDWHEASLLLMQSRVDQVESAEVIRVWERGRPR